jgi:hypothetical protein
MERHENSQLFSAASHHSTKAQITRFSTCAILQLCVHLTASSTEMIEVFLAGFGIFGVGFGGKQDLFWAFSIKNNGCSLGCVKQLLLCSPVLLWEIVADMSWRNRTQSSTRTKTANTAKSY